MGIIVEFEKCAIPLDARTLRAGNIFELTEFVGDIDSLMYPWLSLSINAPEVSPSTSESGVESVL